MADDSSIVIYLAVVNIFAFLSMAFLLFRTRKKLYLPLKKAPKYIVVLLLFILIIAAFLRLSYPSHFIMYCDDFYPMELANMLLHGRITELYQVNFVTNSFLFLLPFAILGADAQTGFRTIILVSLVSLLSVFLLAYALTKDYWASIFATAFLAFSLTHIRLSASTYNHMFVFLLFMLGMYAFVLYKESRRHLLLALCLGSMLLVVFMRIETLLIVVPMALWSVSYNRNQIAKVALAWFLFIAAALLYLPQYSAFFHVQADRPIGMSLQNFLANVGLLPLNPVLLILMALGLLFIIARKRHMVLVLAAVALPQTILYMLLDPSHMADGRHLLFPITLLYIASGYGLSCVLGKLSRKPLPVYLAAFVILVGLPLASAISWTNQLRNDSTINELYFNSWLPDHLEQRLPKHCTILTPHPARYRATTGFHAADLDSNLSILDSDCVIFVLDISCRHPEWEVQGKCDRFLAEHSVLEYGYVDTTMIPVPDRRQVFNYTIYRLDID